MTVDTRSLIVYGPHLFRQWSLSSHSQVLRSRAIGISKLIRYPLSLASKLARLLKGLSPISSSTVVVPKAFLAFDVKGTPFLEPCYANCVVQGYNDTIRSDVTGRSAEREKQPDEDESASLRASEAYKRSIWARCCTGADYEGSLPHPLEGMVFELVLHEFDLLLERLVESSPSAPYALVSVEYTPFLNGDSDKPTSTSRSNRAEILVFDSSIDGPEPHGRHLQPTQQYLAMILRGAFFTGPLTRTYLSHLFLLRPYDPMSSLSKRIMRRIVQLVLLPQFLLFWVPSKLVPGFGAWNKVVGERVCRGWGVLECLERTYERWTGKSGFRN